MVIRARGRNSSRRFAVTCACIALSGWQLIVSASAAPAPLPVKPTYVSIRTIDTDPQVGLLQSFSLADGALIRQGTERSRVATDRIISLRLTPDVADVTPQRAGPPGDLPMPVWTLTNGDVLFGTLTSGGEEALVINVQGIGEVRVSLDRLRRWYSPSAQGPGFRDALHWFEREPMTQDDAVLLTNGDVIRGLLRSIDQDGIVLEGETGPARAPFRLVAAVRLANSTAAGSLGLAAKLSLRDGTILTVSQLDVNEGQASLKLSDDQGRNITLEFVDTIEVINARWEWLSAYPISSFQHTPALNLAFEYQLDRNVMGEAIRVAGTKYDRGIGVHSKARLAYDLQNRYSALVTSFGLDDSSGPLADVDVSILVDGQKRFEQTGVRAGTLIGPVRVELVNAERLELIVDFGQNGDVQDRFNWVEPGLVKAP